MWFYVILLGCVVFRLYWKLSIKWNGSYSCLVGKTAIVTGANSGIGYITALDFAMRGARVILACRNEEKAQNALKKIIASTGNVNVVYKNLDLLSHRSIRSFAEDINNNEDRLDILVNNAGVYLEDETVIQANHVGPFLLTHLLLGKLNKSAPSRIVVVASIAAAFASLNVKNFDKLGRISRVYSPLPYVYRDSKLCNLLFAIELARKIEGSGVTVNAVHPGLIDTGLFDKLPFYLRIFGTVPIRMFFMNPTEGAQTQIYASVSKEVEGMNGKLLSNCTAGEVYRNARDPRLAEMLWRKTEELAQLRVGEKI